MDLLNAMDNFLLACRAEGKQPKTVRSYHDSIKDFINHRGNVELSEITVSDVRNHLISLSERPGRYGSFSTHSSMKHFSVLRTWFRWMKREGFCEVGMETIKPPRTSKKLPSHLLDDEVLLLFRRLRDKGNFRDTLIFELFLDSGLRLNEVVNLDLKDVNIDGGWVKVVGKGDKEDIVPIGNQVSRDLHTYIHIHRKARDGERALFVNQSGFRLAYEGLSGMVRRELSQIRTEGKRGAHTMRHYVECWIMGSV